jgi:hypothetical protein
MTRSFVENPGHCLATVHPCLVRQSCMGERFTTAGVPESAPSRNVNRPPHIHQQGRPSQETVTCNCFRHQNAHRDAFHHPTTTPTRGTANYLHNTDRTSWQAAMIRRCSPCVSYPPTHTRHGSTSARPISAKRTVALRPWLPPAGQPAGSAARSTRARSWIAICRHGSLAIG